MATYGKKSKHKRNGNGDGDSPIIIGDSTTGTRHPKRGAFIRLKHVHGFYQPDSNNLLHFQVRAEDDEGLQVDEVDVPGVDPADITLPWSLLLTNNVSVVANDETLVDITFAAGSTISTSGTGANGGPTKIDVAGQNLLSAAVMANHAIAVSLASEVITIHCLPPNKATVRKRRRPRS